MSASIQQIRAGIAANLATIQGVQVSAYTLPNPTPPTVWVFPDETDYHEASQNGLAFAKMAVRALVGTIADQGAQILMDQMLDPAGAKSVKAAIESDRTLGGLVSDLVVERHNGYQLMKNPVAPDTAPQYLVAQWQVLVLV